MVNWFKLLSFGTDTLTWKLLRLPELRWMNVSYSQEGEDSILHALGIAQNGFYVDVGAYLPKRMSNTYRLYLEGWKGLVVDLNKDCIEQFKKQRPRDICECKAVSNSKRLVEVKVCGEGAFNSIVPDFESQNQGRKAIKTYSVETVTLAELLEKHDIEKVDFLNVDCEGHDFEVLQGIDWFKVKPKVIAVEIMGSLKDVKKDKINSFLTKKGYELVAKTPLTAFYKVA